MQLVQCNVMQICNTMPWDLIVRKFEILAILPLSFPTQFISVRNSWTLHAQHRKHEINTQRSQHCASHIITLRESHNFLPSISNHKPRKFLFTCRVRSMTEYSEKWAGLKFAEKQWIWITNVFWILLITLHHYILLAITPNNFLAFLSLTPHHLTSIYIIRH